MLRSFNLSIAASLAAHIIALALLALVAQKEERKPPAPYFVDIVDEQREPSPAPPEPLVKKPPRAAPRDRPGKKPPPRPMEKPPEAVREKPLTPDGERPPVPAPEEAPGARERMVPGGKDRLFDSEVIAKAAKEPASKEDARGITFDTEELKYQGYMRLLKDKIEGIWVYPRDAAEKGIFGDLVIRFVIRKDGTLGSVEVLRTSGHGMLDEYAVKALRDGEPYWPLPEGWNRKSLTVTGHFIYTLYGVRLR